MVCRKPSVATAAHEAAWALCVAESFLAASGNVQRLERLEMIQPSDSRTAVLLAGLRQSHSAPPPRRRRARGTNQTAQRTSSRCARKSASRCRARRRCSWRRGTRTTYGTLWRSRRSEGLTRALRGYELNVAGLKLKEITDDVEPRPVMSRTPSGIEPYCR